MFCDKNSPAVCFNLFYFPEMAQACLRLGKSLTSQTVRRHFSASSAVAGKHVNYSVQDGVSIIRFDQEGSKVNSLSEETSAELQEAFQKFAGDSSAKSAVLLSGKPGCFIAGADIQMLAR